jgi:hypothetical protein
MRHHIGSKEEFERMLLEAKKKRGFQHIGEGGAGGRGLQYVNPEQAHAFARKHGLPGKNISSSRVSQKYGPGGTLRDHDGRVQKADPFGSRGATPVTQAESDKNFAFRQNRGPAMDKKMQAGAVQIAKGSTNFDQPTSSRIGDIPTPRTDKSMRDFDGFEKKKKLDVLNSFRRHRGEPALVA